MKLYNTLTQRLEPFQPLNDRVSIYVCGITPYDTTHVGHAFTYTSVDILIRYLESLGLDVRYVQNVTDVDDDILRKSRQVGEDWKAVGDRWTRHFIEDMIYLNVRPPDYYPRATDVIAEIIEAVSGLLEAGVAYEKGGNVYFEIDRWPEFGKLSHLMRPEMLPIANERGNVAEDPYKKDPLDFVLWQSQKPGEPGWPSPWGLGRPGWHIECSTMATKYLGETVDIHGGGADLCFPHHECEIAQVEPLTGKKPFVRYWLHTAMVSHDGEKMSKSLGNLVMIRDLLKVYTPDALRLYLGSKHYRDPWSFDEGELKKVSRSALQMLKAVTAPSQAGNGRPLEGTAAWSSFLEAMEDDINTPKAVSLMDSLTEEILEAVSAKRPVENAQQVLRRFAAIFGLRLDRPGPEPRVERGWKEFLEQFQAVV